jgi:glycine/D-amino acid oxidase-like deaminating enzyme/nitrite reductase/ring-hydroxylating ferredoxin subunit
MYKQSVWQHTCASALSYPRLEETLDVDIAIIGAGITGLTTAMQLAESGKSIIVLEAKQIGSGTTGSSTANLYIPIQSQYQSLKSKFNQAVATTVALSRQAAIDYIEQMIAAHNIACHFQRRPWYMFTKFTETNPIVDRELEALKQCGLDAKLVNELPLPTAFTRAISLDKQARFNPLQYLQGLAKVLTAKGVKIFEHSAVIEFKELKEYCEIKLSTACVRAKKIIIATHIPLGFNSLQMKAFPYRSYAVAAHLNNGDYPDGLFWDLDFPHHSISSHSIDSDKLDTLVVAGNHHKTGLPKQFCHEHHFSEVQGYLNSHFDIASFTYHWSAQHYQPADGLPYIGLSSRGSKHCYVATGYSSDGLTYGTMAGILLADLMLARPNAWSEVYKSTRFTPIASAVRLIKDNAQTLGQYLTDYPGNVDTRDYTTIRPGEGKIIEEAGEKWAVHRDKDSKLHVVSAVCTHMKCIVKWNDAEKSWDCPCHGSRFTVQGNVIEGPALSPLKPKPFQQ